MCVEAGTLLVKLQCVESDQILLIMEMKETLNQTLKIGLSLCLRMELEIKDDYEID